jgi:hypothetical protein
MHPSTETGGIPVEDFVNQKAKEKNRPGENRVFY